jgi:hypothetical protein
MCKCVQDLGISTVITTNFSFLLLNRSEIDILKKETMASFHVRSASFPSTSHPITLEVEAQLNMIQTFATPSADEICNNLSLLEDLYKSMDALLNLNQTLQSDELLDESVKILDICGSIIDLVSQIKENVRDVQSALRRRNSSIQSSIAKYTSFQKETKKEAKRLISSLKQMQIKTDESTTSQISAVAVTIFSSF